MTKGTDMDFSITVKPTLEEYKRFNHVVHNAIGKTRVKTIVLCLLLLLITGYLFWIQEYLIALLLFAAWTLTIVLAKAKAERNIKKAWNSNAVLRENESVFRFTESGIDVTASNGCSHIEYDKLYRLIETKTHFYLLSAVNMGSGFPKSLCTPEQQDFIRMHCLK